MPRNKKEENRYDSPFAQNFRDLMDGKVTKEKVTQETIAKLIGTTRQTISQYYNGTSVPSYESLVKIADYFEVTTDYLLGRTKDPSPKPSAVDELGLSVNAINNIKEIGRYNATLWFNELVASPEFPILIHSIKSLSKFLSAEISFIEDSIASGSAIESIFDFESRQRLKLVEILEEISPQLKERIFLNIGISAVTKQMDEIKTCFTYITEQITDWNHLRQLRQQMWKI